MSERLAWVKGRGACADDVNFGWHRLVRQPVKSRLNWIDLKPRPNRWTIPVSHRFDYEPCMFKSRPICSTALHRVPAMTSVARNRGDAIAGSRSFEPEPSMAEPQQDPARLRVHSSEQPTEPLATRSYSQERIFAMPQSNSDQSVNDSSKLVLGIDVSGKRLDLAFSDVTCSPKSSPPAMRVFKACLAKETIDEGQEAQAGTDHHEAS